MKLSRPEQFPLWSGRGIAQRVLMSNSSIETWLREVIDHAAKLRAERESSTSVMKFKSWLASVGTGQSQLQVLDLEDIVGLIGEAAGEQLLQWSGVQPVFIKWRLHGTSKSRGLDIVGRTRKSAGWELIVYECKHIYEEAKSKSAGDVGRVIRHRFSQGLNELEEEKTLINLAWIALQLAHAVQKTRAAGGGTRELDERFDTLCTNMRTRDYTVEVVVSLDVQYCDPSSLKESAGEIERPMQVGDRTQTLTLMQVEAIAGATSRICKELGDADR